MGMKNAQNYWDWNNKSPWIRDKDRFALNYREDFFTDIVIQSKKNEK